MYRTAPPTLVAHPRSLLPQFPTPLHLFTFKMPEGGTIIPCAACDAGWDAKVRAFLSYTRPADVDVKHI